MTSFRSKPKPPATVSCSAVVVSTVSAVTRIDVNWPTPPASGKPLGGFIVYRNGTELASLSAAVRTYQDSDAPYGTSASYGVAAVSTSAVRGTQRTSNAVLRPRVPVWVNAPTSVSATPGQQFSMAFASDRDGLAVTYSLVSPPSGYSITTAGALTAGSASGSPTVRATNAVGLYADTVVAVAVAGTSNATYVIPVSTATRTYDAGITAGFNGANWVTRDGVTRRPQAGDIIELAAGTHGVLRFRRIEGTASSPITIRGSQSGLVTIRRVNPSTGDFVVILESRYAVLDGYLSSAERGCGIVITYAANATTTNRDAPSSFLNMSDSSAWEAEWVASGATLATRNPALRRPSGFTTVRYVKVDGGHVGNRVTGVDATSLSSDGIGFQTNDHLSYRYTENNTGGTPTLWREGYVFEYNWIKNVQGEGMYFGPNWRNTTPTNPVAEADDIPTQNMVVRHNRLENLGGDAISIKSAFGAHSYIYGNYVYNGTTEWGFSGDHTVGGIGGFGNIDFYGNYLELGACPAITNYIYQVPSSLPFPQFLSRVYNNIVVNFEPCPARASADGITMGGDATSVKLESRVYNNTIVDVRNTEAINFNSYSQPASYARNNLCADASPITDGPGTQSNNWIGTIAAARFVDYANRNFRLLADSPAVDTVTSGYPDTDYYGTVRPQGVAGDQGAAEYQGEYARTTYYTSDYSSGRLNNSDLLQDGGSLRCKYEPEGDPASLYTLPWSGGGTASNLDARVVSSLNSSLTGNSLVTPRKGSYFFGQAIYYQKSYVSINDDDPTRDNPRVEYLHYGDPYRFDWDREFWVGFSLFLPVNHWPDRGGIGHQYGTSLYVVNAGPSYSQIQLFERYMSGQDRTTEYSHWAFAWQNRNNVVGDLMLDDSDPTSDWIDLGSQESDVGKWTDFVFRVRLNPFSVTTNPAQAGIANARNVTFEGNKGILEIWKSTGAVDANGNRTMTKMFSRVNLPVGGVPHATERLKFQGPCHYKYGWKKFTTSSTQPRWMGVDEYRMGFASPKSTWMVGPTQYGTTGRDVNPSGLPLP